MVERGDLMASEINQYKIVLVMVGLPGRGKSFISRKIELYLSWSGIKTKVRTCCCKDLAESHAVGSVCACVIFHLSSGFQRG